MKFEENIRLIYKEKGDIWLKNLPNLINQLASHWNLSNLIPYENLTYNYILKGTQGEKPIVLKIGIDIESLERECEALTALKGHRVVSIIDHCQGAILLEQAIPGDSLISLFPEQDIKALEIACELANSMHKASNNHSFPLLSTWLEIIDQEWNLPAFKLELARQLKNDLLKESKSNVLLHGDLHYDNIISQGGSYIAIDAKGVIGDSIYDIACLLRNPLEVLINQPNVDILLKSRIEFVAKYINVPVAKIQSWLYVHTVMSICWSLEDGQDVAIALKFLEVLYHQMQNN